MHSIRIKITAIAIAAVLAGILSVFAASFLIIQSETDKNSVRMMNLIDQDTSKSLEKYFESIEQSVEVASNIAVDSMDSVFLVECGVVNTGEEDVIRTPEQTDALDSYLVSYCSKIQEFFAGVADCTYGVSAYYYCIDPQVSQREKGFYYRKIGKTGFIEQEPIDVNSLEKSDPLTGTWYEAALKKGRPAWVGPYLSGAQENEWIYSFFVPIYKAGMCIGVMGMDIPCETLAEQVRDIRVYNTGYICLLDENGNVIYHPELSIGSDLTNLGMNVGFDVFQKASNEEELIRYKAGTEDRQMSFSTLSNGMKLVAIAPAKEINAPWYRLIRAILMISIAVILIFGVAALFLLRVITEPLAQLTDASVRLADGNYDVDLNYESKDEIGTLTSAFKRMRDQIRDYISNLNHQLRHDRMTDLPNMRHFFALAEETRKSMLEAHQQPIMLYFDIIGLKHYNRQYGFLKGDELIKAFAQILSRHFGDQKVCRLNGDRFAAVADEKDAEEKIQSVFHDCETVLDGTRLTVRVGAYPDRLETVDVNVAIDRAKYAGEQKKGELSSTITFFDEEMLRKGEISRHITNNLDRALEEGWVKVYYQPIIRAADGKICDEEALARWIDPELGFLSPAYFIPSLEESKQIYKLDLYVLEQVLKKMKLQAEAGIYVVPQSVNLSRMDFESCDIVEEIRRRVDEAGVARSMITVEITESVIGGDFEFMKEQVARFQALGFPVWMDDFGSGYSSLDVLQQIHFDLIKFDMRFMERFEDGEASRIILTELMNMAIGLGTETICEGVETLEQAEFLREIGCTRIQGYYYGKPIPFEGIVSQFEKGSALEYENPEESEYYSSIGRINLYDMTALANENDDSLSQYFNTLPMAIIEVTGTIARYNRCNSSYRDFLKRTMGMEYITEDIDCLNSPDRRASGFLKAVYQCSIDGNRTIFDDRVNEDTVAHTLIRRVAVNPVSGTAAIAVAVLAVIRETGTAGVNYGEMARALSSDYVDLYYVNLDTGEFTEYRPDAEREDLILERHGEDFFRASQKDAVNVLYADDQESFLHSFTEEAVREALNRDGLFRTTYRIMIDGKPVYVEMKAVRMPGNGNHIMVGVRNIDAEMRQKEEISRAEAERTVYSRIRALNQGIICIYTVDPETGHYVEQRTGEYEELDIPREGDDFFQEALREGERFVSPEDLPKYHTLMTKENILKHVRENGVYAFQYRLMIGKETKYVSLKAVMVDEKEGEVLIVGVNDIDAQIKHDQDYERKLSNARTKANLDSLTGVKTKSAYEYMFEHLARQIEDGQNVTYAIVFTHLNDLSSINETLGREAGDQRIREVCDLICNTFKHSPVFRLAGDQFAVLAQSHDFEYIDSLIAQLKEFTEERNMNVSIGMAKYDGSESPSSVFARAEALSRGHFSQ